MKANKANLKSYFTRNKGTIRVAVLILAIALIPIISWVVITIITEEPYFIIIDSDEDFLQWCEKGNGTIMNPYVIAGHRITVPEEWERQIGDDTTPCTLNPLISVN